MSPSHDSIAINCYHMRIKWRPSCSSPCLPACCATPSISAPACSSASPYCSGKPPISSSAICLAGATHYGLHLTLGEIDVGLRSPSLTLGPTTLLDDERRVLVAFEGLRLIPEVKESWRQRALVLAEATLTAPRVDLVRLPDSKGQARCWRRCRLRQGRQQAPRLWW